MPFLSPRFSRFDRTRLTVEPLDRREHLIDLSSIFPLRPTNHVRESLRNVGVRVRAAKENGSAVVMMMGGHVLRSGVQRYLIDLIKNGYISCLAMNGAGIIHDFELALIGATTESVARYVRDGRFGLWRETGLINDIVNAAAKQDLGLGEAVGRFIEMEELPHRNISLLAAAYRFGCPATVHVGIGYDIVHEHPNCDGAAYGQTSYTDFLRFAKVLESLEGGVTMNFGSAVMAPEVFLKALTMVRNVMRSENRQVRRFTTLVCDLLPLPEDFQREAPKDTHGYYFRPWKTMLIRTVADGGESFYVKADHSQTVPELWTAITQQNRNRGSTGVPSA
ncbi:MAG: hypothetical protein JRJ86_06480 [Deltaproteobacteria bacterium]|nr:hypothetical protein [Deltaproteobacteria bacterium]MBW2342576.1 hypothetical protein [Deltaproteobacteria bacterium]